MSVHSHRHAAGARSVRVHVVVVSTTRTEKTDRSGRLIRELVTEAEHVVTGVDFVVDDPRPISQLLDTLCQRVDVEVVILSGGTGISKRDGTFEVVSSRITKAIPGFGELFRMLSFQEIGAAAMLSRATCGLVGDTLVAAIPGSTGAVRLAMQSLLLPELSHISWELSKELPLEDSETVESNPSRAEQTAEQPAGWREILATLGGAVVEESWPDIPEEYKAVAAVNDVLCRSGQRRSVAFDDGTSGLILGYPDLARPDSAVLLVRDTAPEVVALHRVDGPVDDSRWSWASTVGPNSRLGTLLLRWTRI